MPFILTVAAAIIFIFALIICGGSGKNAGTTFKPVVIAKKVSSSDTKPIKILYVTPNSDNCSTEKYIPVQEKKDAILVVSPKDQLFSEKKDGIWYPGKAITKTIRIDSYNVSNLYLGIIYAKVKIYDKNGNTLQCNDDSYKSYMKNVQIDISEDNRLIFDDSLEKLASRRPTDNDSKKYELKKTSTNVNCSVIYKPEMGNECQGIIANIDLVIPLSGTEIYVDNLSGK